MEIYGSVYRNSLKKPLARVKKIQEILGDIHDCDVWIDHITLILIRERNLLRSSKGTKRPDTTTLASLKMVLLGPGGREETALPAVRLLLAVT